MAKSSSLVKSTSMRRLALPVLFAAACSGQVQETRKEPAPPTAAPAAVAPAPAVGDEVAIDYRPQSEGQALIEVAGPAGARVDVREGQALIGRDTAPMSIKAQADHWYAVSARLPSGTAREAKVQAQAAKIASLRFVDLAPQGPQPISREAFKA